MKQLITILLLALTTTVGAQITGTRWDKAYVQVTDTDGNKLDPTYGLMTVWALDINRPDTYKSVVLENRVFKVIEKPVYTGNRYTESGDKLRVYEGVVEVCVQSINEELQCVRFRAYLSVDPKAISAGFYSEVTDASIIAVGLRRKITEDNLQKR